MAIGRISGRMLKDDLVRDTSLTFNTDTLVVDYTNGRIGIGTATPGTPLEVVGDSKLANVSISNNTISSTEVDADLILAPNGTGNISMSGATINNVADPTEDQDVATKIYVDGIIDNTEDRLGNLYVDDVTITSIPSDSDHIIDAEEGLFIVDGTAGIVIPTGTSDERRDPATEGTLRYNTTIGQLEVYDGVDWKAFGIDQNITNQMLTGDGSTTTFTLIDTATTLTVIVSINGTLQEPVSAYSVTDTTLTFTEAPGSSDVIHVRRIASIRDFNILANGDATAVVYATDEGEINITGTETDFSGNLTVAGDITVNGNINIDLEDLQNVSITAPAVGEVLQWDGTQWTPAEPADASDSDLLQGQNGAYYLNYSNFTGNITDAGTATIAGNLTAGNISTAGTITGDVVGDVTGNLTGDVTGDLVGDVTAVDITASGTASVTGNITGGNISSAGTITKGGIEVATVNDISTLNATLVDNSNDIIELEEEIEALAPSFDRGNWEHDTSAGSGGATPGTGEYYLADSSNNITQNFSDTAKIYFDNTDSQTPALTHTFDDVTVGMYVELFESGDSSFYLGTVTAIAQNTGYTVFDVTVVKAEGTPSLTGGVRVKFFELADASVNLDGYLQTSGGTLTGLLTMNKAGGTALTVQDSGTTTLTVLNDGTVTTTKTTFGNDHLITKNYVDDNTVSKTANNTITTTTNIYQGTSADRFHKIKSYAPLDGVGAVDTSTAWGLEVDIDHQNSGKNTFKVTTRLGDVFRINGGTSPTLNTGYAFKTTRSSFTLDNEYVPKSYVDTAVSNVDTSSLGLATVATTGSYTSLTNKPTIPAATTNYVQTNTTGFSNNLTITKSGNKYYISGG